MASDTIRLDRPPSRAVALAVSGALVALWGYVRLVLFDTVMFPLTYVLPLFIGVWTRDRLALWGMAVAFLALHTLKIGWLMPEGMLTPVERTANYTATLLNILVGTLAVHAIIQLRERLERTLADVRAQADELRTQSEELAQQAEELSQQTEELAQQGEEVASQNEELMSQAEEIGALNEALHGRESLLQTLLDTTRLSGSEQTALEHTARTGSDLFKESAAIVAVYERTQERLELRAVASDGVPHDPRRFGHPDDRFVSLVLGERKTAGLNDAALRPDLTPSVFPGLPECRAVLCAPIPLESSDAALAVYSRTPCEWTEDQFQLVEWLAGECGRTVQALRVQADLRDVDRRRNEFLATLSHELRNPLAPIGSALGVIETSGRYDAQAVSVMRRQLQQLVRLVDDLLDATRLSLNKIQIRRTRTDLVPIVQQAVDAMRSDVDAAQQTMEVRLPDTPVWLDADPHRMAQVAANLIANATRYTPPGGRVIVTVQPSDSDVVLSVADNGIGLEGKDLQRVFEMFMQVGGPGSGGLGIGLALVQGIVERHDGHVRASSGGRNQGSEFVVTLPLAPAAPDDRPRENGRAMTGKRPRRVLVVDDNTDSAEMMGTLLELHGHHVRIANDAESALVMARGEAPDVALLDIGLPGLNGYELAKRLRADERTRHMRLVALTGWGQDGDRAKAQEAGFDLHLTKPADLDLVLMAINRES